MAHQIILPVWPTTLDCLSWSQDNLLAVAGGDHIGILLPRLRDSGPNGTHWDNILLKVNAFTAEEVPLADPLSFDHVSIGEELSLRHVQTLEWSPPGLGKFGRCVLAVLSSNHVLSLWACEGKLDVSANWKRVVIVNHELRKHYGAQNLDGDLGDERDELQQVAQRVRALAWSPQQHKTSGSESSVLTYQDQSFLAVSTERGDIVILRVVSPYRILHLGVEDWKVQVVHSFSTDVSVLKLQSGVNGINNTLYHTAKESYIADHLAWSALDDNKRTKLAFIVRGEIFCVDMAIREGEETSGPLVADVIHRLLPAARSDLTGPLRFVTQSRMLIVFAADAVLCINIDLDQQDESSTSHHLDERWDEVSGVAFSASISELPLINITSLLSGSTAPTTVLSVPLHKAEKSSQPLWQDAISESKRSFSRQHNLDGHVQARVWGIASSPLGDMVATASVMLPSDAPAYITGQDYRTIINITFEIPSENNGTLLTSGGTCRPFDVNSETLLFSLQRALERRSNAMDAESILDVLLNPAHQTGSFEFDRDVSFPQEGSVLQYVRYLRSLLFRNPLIMQERHKILVDMATSKAVDTTQISNQVLQHLVPAILKLPTEYQQAGSLSQKTYKVYRVLNLKLQEGGKDVNIQDLAELCRICRSTIPFESVKWAKCGSGHQFSRCGLTFVAIQEPNVTKHCNICDSHFINEWAFSALFDTRKVEDTHMTDLTTGDVRGSSDIGHEIQAAETQSSREQPEDGSVRVSDVESTAIEPPCSLARLLFATFDTCIYCGGNYTV